MEISAQMIRFRDYTRVAAGILLIAKIALIGVQAHAATSTVVYPTGVFPNDVANVQAALNLGGTIILKAVNAAGEPTAFNFGTPELLPGRRVLVSTDVSIIGEQSGSAMTTIQGGLEPIRCNVPVQLTIQGIYFNGPLGDAIEIGASTGAVIIGNRIDSVVPIRFPRFSFGDGIDVSAFDASHTITGKIVVSGNVITNLTADCCAAIQFDSVSAESEITGNVVKSFSTIGILAIRSGQTSVLIANNLVVPGPDFLVSASIFIDGNPQAAFLVTDNVVVSDNLVADGILVGGLFSEGTVAPAVRRNHVTMHNSQFGGISIYGQVTGAVLEENEIDGDSAFALQIAEGFSPTQVATSNRLQGNNISHTTPSIADIYLGTNTHRNEVLGQCSSVIDLGAGNFVTCGRLTTGQGQGHPHNGQLGSLQGILQQPLQKQPDF
jgi:hypothetical protein